jgi:hypothetical protein
VGHLVVLGSCPHSEKQTGGPTAVGTLTSRPAWTAPATESTVATIAARAGVAPLAPFTALASASALPPGSGRRIAPYGHHLVLEQGSATGGNDAIGESGVTSAARVAASAAGATKAASSGLRGVVLPVATITARPAIATVASRTPRSGGDDGPNLVLDQVKVGPDSGTHTALTTIATVTSRATPAA